MRVDVVLGKIALDGHRQVFGQFLAFPDGVEQECAAFAQAAGDVVHVQVGLYVACHEVGGVHKICGTDGLVAETQV